MTTRTVEASSTWILQDDAGALCPPEVVEQACGAAMEKLLDIEQETHGIVHSASVSATLSRAEVVLEFCVDVPSVQAGERLIGDTIARITAIGSSSVEERRSSELVGA